MLTAAANCMNTAWAVIHTTKAMSGHRLSLRSLHPQASIFIPVAGDMLKLIFRGIC